MPWIRITILIKNQPALKNIRFEEVGNIDVLQFKYTNKARDHYRSCFIDCEVAIISKTSNAVKSYLQNEQDKLEAKKWPAENNSLSPFNKKKKGESGGNWAQDALKNNMPGDE